MRRPHIGAHRNIHANEATGAREGRAEGECKSGRRAQGGDQGDDDEQDGPHHGDGSVLTGQVGGCTLLNCVRNLLHPGIAGGQPEDPAPLNETVGNCGESAKG